ncbi:hypothetical protein MJH12_03630, partial [bacterium]|nr:hypothetical protein [bacterium]
EIDKAKMEAVLGAKGEGSWGYDPSTVLANPLLEDPNLKLTIRTYCKAEMTESRARKCATAVSQANGKINAKQEELDAEGKSVNANAVALREDMIRLTKSMNLIKNVVGGTATLVEDGTKCNSNYKDSVTLNARYQPLFTKVTELDSKFDNIVAQSKLEFQTSYTNGVAKVLSQCKDPDKKDQIAELLSSAEKELANVRKNDPTNETMIRELLEKVEALKLISN